VISPAPATCFEMSTFGKQMEWIDESTTDRVSGGVDCDRGIRVNRILGISRRSQAIKCRGKSEA
jgi:hypothetical protein